MTGIDERTDHPDEAVQRGHKGDGRDKTFEIAITYSGPDKEIEVSKDETIATVLARAIAAFSITTNQHTLALYTPDGVELRDESQTVKSAGIKKRDRLLLRPSAVKAG
jgi:hypothetical protein